MYHVIVAEPFYSFLRGAAALGVGALLLTIFMGIIDDLKLELDEVFIGCLMALGIIILSVICGAFLATLFGKVPQ